MKRIQLITIVLIMTASTGYSQSSGISMGNATSSGAHAFAAGEETIASGTASLAFGLHVEARGDYSFACLLYTSPSPRD